MKKLLIILLLIVGCSLFTKKGTCIVGDIEPEVNFDAGCIGGNCWCWEDMTLDECAEIGNDKNKVNLYYEEPNDISCADYCVLEGVIDACINYPPP